MKIFITKSLNFIKENGTVISFFLLLIPLLFMGDGKQTIADLYGTIMALFLVVFAVTHYKKRQLITSETAIIWLIFFVYLAARMATSDDTGYSVCAIARYAEAFLIYYIFYCYQNNKTVWVFILATTALCLLAVVITGIVTYIPGLGELAPSMSLIYPAYGHNHVVDILIFGAGISVPISFMTNNRIFRIITVIYIAATFFSLARAALFLIAVYFAGVYIFSELQKKHVNIIKTALLLQLIIVMSLVYTLIPTNIFDKNIFVVHASKQTIKPELRTEYWRQAVAAIKEHPLFGSGPGTFSILSLRYQQSSGKYSFYAHNFLLETLAELGLIGSVPLLFFLWVGIRKISIYLYKKKPENMRLLNVPIFGALALSLAYSMVDYSFNYLLIWLVFWAMFGLLSGSTDESHAK